MMFLQNKRKLILVGTRRSGERTVWCETDLHLSYLSLIDGTKYE